LTVGSRRVGLDNVSSANLGEDGGRCLLINNSAAKRFWTPTLTDIWYKCDPGTTTAWNTGSFPLLPPNKCAQSSNAWGLDAVQIELTANNNWSAPEIDNDLTNPWCTPPDSTKYSPFACTKIKCKMQRPLISPDSTYDWSFDYAAGNLVNPSYSIKGATVNPSEDFMIIQAGRARVWITSGTYTVGLAGPSPVPSSLGLGYGTGMTSFPAGSNGYIAISITAGATAVMQASTGLLVLCYLLA
jgi:hypothetical protein